MRVCCRRRRQGRGSRLLGGRWRSAPACPDAPPSLTGGAPSRCAAPRSPAESSGKTTLALHAMAEVQRQGGAVALIDAEHAFDPVFAKVRARQARHPCAAARWPGRRCSCCVAVSALARSPLLMLCGRERPPSRRCHPARP